MFGEAALEHQKLYGTKDEHFGYVAYKNHKHSKNNPYAQLQNEIPLDVIMDKKYHLYGPLTLFQACPVGDGAGSAILCNERFLAKHPHLRATAVEIVGQALVSDLPSSFDKSTKRFLQFLFKQQNFFLTNFNFFCSFRDLCGFQLCKKGAEMVYAQSNLTPEDVDVLEVHDCFSSNELMMYEAMGLCKDGEGSILIDNGEWITNSAGGELFQLRRDKAQSTKGWVVNASGGLESKGHPLGATGLAQCAELCWQVCHPFFFLILK